MVFKATLCPVVILLGPDCLENPTLMVIKQPSGSHSLQLIPGEIFQRQEACSRVSVHGWGCGGLGPHSRRWGKY